MRTIPQTDSILFNLEAPGDLLSELLGVCEASAHTFEAGTVRAVTTGSGQWQVVAPVSGAVNIAWGDRSWTLRMPQAAAFPGSTEFALLAGEPCVVRFLSLCGSVADTVLKRCQKEGGLFFENGGLAVEHAFSLLSSRGGDAAPASAASEAAYSLLMTLYGTQSSGPEERKHVPPVVEAALGIIRHDYAFLDGIGDLAQRLEVSQEYLTRCFCRYVGITPGKYLTRVRIENARLLLRQGGHSVQFVAEACGFTNANYFARVFRTAVGMNPAEYARHQPSAGGSTHDEELYVL